MRRRATLLLLPFALLALLLVGCGDDDDSADADTTTEAESPDSDGDGDEDDPGTDPGEEGDDDASTTTGDGTATTAGDDTDDAAFCAAYAAFGETADALPHDTIEQLREGTTIMREELAAMAEVAPDELQGDFATIVGVLEEFQAIVDAADSVEAAEAEGETLMDESGYYDAGQNIEAYADMSCPEDDDVDG